MATLLDLARERERATCASERGRSLVDWTDPKKILGDKMGGGGVNWGAEKDPG